MIIKYTCLNPSLAVCLFTDSDGKQHLKFKRKYDDSLQKLRDKYGSDFVYQLPCGQCEACRINYASDWSTRLLLEKEYHKYAYFITLTYDDEHLINASHHDLKRFIEVLQGTHHENDVVYFACKEFGKRTHRLHYHVIVMLDYPLDLYDRCCIDGYYYYHSIIISNAWDKGLHNLCDFNGTGCFRYVAKYCSKDGSKVYMSRNIGKRYFYDHYKEIIKNNFTLYGDFNENKRVSIPRAMFYWFKDVDCPEVDDWKKIKSEIAKSYTYQKARDSRVSYEDEVIKLSGNRFKDNQKHFKERRF